MTCITVYGRTV